MQGRGLARMSAIMLLLMAAVASRSNAAECPGWTVAAIGVAAITASRCDWSDLADAAIQRQELAMRSVAAKPAAPSGRLGADPFDRRLEDALKKSVRPAVVAVNAPAQLEPGKAGTIRAVLLTAENQTAAGPPGLIGDGADMTRISVTADMQIALLANDMDITPQDSDWRTLTRIAPSAWSWRVTPTEAGERTITLVVRGKVRIGEDDKSFDLHHVTHRLAVVETTQGQVMRHVGTVKGMFDAARDLWLAIAGVGAVLGALFLRMFRRKTKDAVKP